MSGVAAPPSTRATAPAAPFGKVNADGTQARFAEGTHGHVLLTGNRRARLQTFVFDRSQNQQTVRLSGVEPGQVNVVVTSFDDQGALVGQAQARQVQVVPDTVTQVLGSDLSGVGPSAGIDFNNADFPLPVTVENGKVPIVNWDSFITFSQVIWAIESNDRYGFLGPVSLGVTPEDGNEVTPLTPLTDGVTYYVLVDALKSSGSATFVYQP